MMALDEHHGNTRYANAAPSFRATTDSPGKVIRQNRLFDERSGRSVIVAVDHALDHGHIAGLHDMAQTLTTITGGAPDGLLVRPATLKRYASSLATRGGPALIAALDSRMTATLPGGKVIGEQHRLVADVKHALALGADAIKVLLIFGRNDLDVHADNIERVAQVISEADQLGVPVMVETVLWGLGVRAEHRSDPGLIRHMCRIGVELGADIVKAPYVPGAYAGFAEQLPVPVVVLGGGPTDEDSVYDIVAAALDEGVAGVAIGRNVFQAEDPARVTARLRVIVHGVPGAARTREEMG